MATQVRSNQASGKIINALQARQYAAAIDAARTARASAAEIDFAIGEIILQGWADAAPAQRPHEKLEQGLALIEKAALAGHPPAISGLAALFFTGLPGNEGGQILIARDTALHMCWKTVEANPDQASSCIAQRKKQ